MMTFFSTISIHPNSTVSVPQLQDNSSGPGLPQSHPYYVLCYCILILAIIFGNVLVCLAVLRERSLQTTTNYLVVSLAVADLLLATLVMPRVVYLEILAVGGQLQSPQSLSSSYVELRCGLQMKDIFKLRNVLWNLLKWRNCHPIKNVVTRYVAYINFLSCIFVEAQEHHVFSTRTTSPTKYLKIHDKLIFNIEEKCRYKAVVMPLRYQYIRGPKSYQRVSIMITMVWLLSFAVSSPLLFGFNTTDDPSVCSVSDPDFVIYSSVVSFYLPFLVTLLLYTRIYIVLRQRQRKRILTRQGCHCVNASYKQEQHSERTDLHQGPPGTSLWCKCADLRMPSENKPLRPSFSSTGDNEDIDLKVRRKTKEQKLEVHKLSNGKTVTSVKLLSQQYGTIQLKEKKATQMVAIVLGTFMVCWLPFFLTHILNTHCQTCHVPPELYSAATWLGYVNSALNPVIYTTFNKEFRKAFLKILYC